MRHLLLALISMAGLFAPTGGSPPLVAAAAVEPEFSIGLSFSSGDKFPLKSLIMAIVAPNGKPGWQFEAAVKSGIDSVLSQKSIKPDNWFTNPGKYSFVVSYQIDKSPPKSVKVEQEYLADGSELGFSASLWFVEDEETKKAFLSDLTIRRVTSGSGEVSLQPNWTPAASAQPRYRIVNRLKQPIYGVGLWGNFFGDIQTNVIGAWQDYSRGGFCGTVGTGEPIAPGESGESIEGYFIGGPKQFVEGRYRYVVLYSLTSVLPGVPSEYFDKGVTRKRFLELYELRDEFYIANGGK